MSDRRRIILTGAQGFTGRYFAEMAASSGHEVMPVDADLRDPPAIREALSGLAADYVVHLAAISAVTHESLLDFYAVNTIGTQNLLEAIEAVGLRPDMVLLASSANVYGNTDESPIPETATPAPTNHYAMSKLAMEHMVCNFMGRLPVVITRPFNYTGIGQDDRFLIPKLVRHFAGKATSISLGNLDIEREFNDVRVVCEAYLRLLEKAEPGTVYNICSGRPVSLTQLLETLSELTGHQMDVKVDPDLVRPNEVQRLCGDPSRLEACVGPLPHPSLAEMLQRMIAAEEGRSP